MGIGSAINIAGTGLRVTQDDLGVIASNIANAETEGFTRRRLVQGEVSAGGDTIGVRTITVERAINEEVQDQLRDFAAVNVNNQIQADFLGRLDVAFGEPGSPTAIDTSFNQALASLEALAASPEDFSAQIQAVTDLQVFTGQLNNLSQTVQDLRQEADIAIAETVTQANQAIAGIVELNSRIVSEGSLGNQPVALLDERDRLIDELAQIIDIEVERNNNNTVQIRTTSGISLVESQPFFIDFQRAGTVTPETTLDNGILSSIFVRSGGTFEVDLLASGQIEEGALAAYTQLRDGSLQQIQDQLDEFAAQIALAVSNVEVGSTAITDGLEVDVSALSDGNTVSLGFTDTTGAQRTVTLVQVSDPAQLPLADDFTADPNDLVFGLDLSAATAATDIQNFLNGLTPATGLTAATAAGNLQFTATA
ncbi:MAG: flagellar hook-associated protein FlgK, partial [Pseudomonadota bacterium]